MLTRYVALVTEESAITRSELSAVAGALQKQVSRDFGPIWRIEADVAAFANLEDVPLDYWPVIIKDNIGDPSAAGYHEDKNGQPFALVQYSSGWTLTASHEVLEMLADPFGRRMVAGSSPVRSQGRVNFLVEVCDPSEAEEFSYSVNGIPVSDFYTPQYFDPVKAPGVRYSYKGVITEPRQVLKGGYLSWYHPASRRWWQRTWFSGSKPADRKLSLNVQNGNVRAAIDRVTELARARVTGRVAPSAGRGGRAAALAAPASIVRPKYPDRAQDLREAIRAVSEGVGGRVVESVVAGVADAAGPTRSRRGRK
jgi:hypothetical protein